LGNVVAFGGAWLSVRSQGGRLLLRVEDIDRERSRDEIAEGQRRDLEWLGLCWDEETLRQSERDYAPWLRALSSTTYRCQCTRRQVREAGGVYPGTCRDLDHQQGALRLRLPSGGRGFLDQSCGQQQMSFEHTSDPILVTRVGNVAYPLAVVVDDIADGVTEVVRGCDLLAHTAAQMELWELLGASPPSYQHMPTVLGSDGRKLSKSHASTSVRELREAGWSAQDVWRCVLPWLGIHGAETLSDAAERYLPSGVQRGPITVLRATRPGELDYGALTSR